MKKGEYSSYEDVLLAQSINRHVDSKGSIKWKDMRNLQGRHLKSMQNRWTILKKKYEWDGDRYNLKHVPRKYEGTLTQKVEQYFAENPNARPKDVCRDLNVNHNTVYSVRRKMLHKGLISIEGNATPMANVENARKAPLNKRVKVSRSFLWGAIKYERYE